MTASAYAADLPVRAPPPPPPPVLSWTGCYVGINGGGALTRSQSLLYIETFGGAPFFPAAGGAAEFGSAAFAQRRLRRRPDRLQPADRTVRLRRRARRSGGPDQFECDNRDHAL